MGCEKVGVCLADLMEIIGSPKLIELKWNPRWLEGFSEETNEGTI